VIRRENTVESRRGYATYMALSAAGSQLTVYSNRIVALNSTTLTYDSNGTGTGVNFNGSYTAPSGFKMRSAEAISNLYLTTTLGVQVATSLSTASGTIRKAGAPRSLDPSYSLTGASGFLANNTQCAYRCVIQRTDANNNVLYGYPSTRLHVYNTAGGSRNVILTLYLPSEVTTSDVIQFYRTTQEAYSSSDTAGDEMGLVYQVNPTSSDISNGYLTFTDSITDALIGATLYTSPSQEGIAQANERPPLCKDLALYKSAYMMYANTSTKQRLYFTLVGTSGLTGNTITLAGTTYNFGASEIISGGGSPQVIVGSSGVAAADIESTARSLVRVINRYASNTSVYAYYLSGADDLPGQILIEERTVGGSAFTVQSSNSAISAMFFPPPPVSPATNTQSTSSNQVQLNGLYYSKSSQPEHVPLLNYIPVGPASKQILGIRALRDSLIIIKEEGVYRLTGETPSSFSVVPLDLTVFCKAPNSIVVLANQVFMLSNQGVVAISDNGVQVVSRDIEPSLLPLITYSNVDDYTYGCAYESERSYLLSTISASGDTAPNQTYVYNIFTKAWTRWSFGFTSAIVEPTTDKLYFTKSGASFVYRERKDFADTDYNDPEYAATIVSISGTSVTFSVSGVTPLAGWAIKQAGTTILISSISASGSNWIAVMDSTPPAAWAAGAADLLPYVGYTVKWNAWTGGQPGLLKHVRQAEIFTDNITGNDSATKMVATFSSDLDSNVDSVTISISASSWGVSPWGVFPWGGVSKQYGYPTYVPMNKQYCRLFNLGVTHQAANQKISVTGFSVTFEMISERTSK